ncbi:pyruvate kinase [Spongiibacter taiwanensis]|uniref:pyruvate kinase n=1 Tax=Spongiibacter taiwanensis TaxID=1748242 RepID=UPI0020353F32|nr:pyruvate kinase [Spongiibacter taiwanensis]USA44061.1 pyruvate kinase [Spongiibacter taiwanensis]
MRRTKIVATVGPACDSRASLAAMVKAGVNVFRLNFSHGTAEEHRARAALIREVASEQNQHVGLLGDLQGPKIRLRKLAQDPVRLQPGLRLVLDTRLADGEGDGLHLGVDYEPLARSVSAGDTLLLDDGRLRLVVEKVEGEEVHCVSESAGNLHSRKGINRLGGGLSAPALTEKDMEDIQLAAEIGLDFIAVSFPSSADDIHDARSKLQQAGCLANIIGKIERAEAVANEAHLDELIRACDGVMVARGDLGVEIGDASLIGLQKHIIKRSRVLNRPVITATQMMESMIQNPVPTRAEVFDVANAVLDGTDAVMLSAETASGQYPVETVVAMARNCEGAEQYPSARKSSYRLERQFDSIQETLAMSAVYAANHQKGVKAIVSLTETGRTVLLMSRLTSGIPIYAFSSHGETCSRVSLYRGVYAQRTARHDTTIEECVAVLKEKGHVAVDDVLLVTLGDTVGIDGHTNTLKMVRVS